VNLAHIIDGHPDDDVALISRGRPTTYGALREQVARLRGGLASIGVGADDRVVLLFGNGRFFTIMYLASIGVGAAVVPLNPASPSAEIAREIRAVGATVVAVGPAGAGSWSGVDRTALPTVRAVVVAEPDADAGGSHTLDELLAAEPVDVAEVGPDHLAALMFTSGTAGAPKAAMLSHGNLLASIHGSLRGRDPVRRGDVVYGVLPMFHIFGLNVVVGLTLAAGATVVMVQRFDPTTAIETIGDRNVTVVPGAPTMWIDFSLLDLPPDTFAGVRLALSGAAKLKVEVMEAIRGRYGIDVREGYGLTEASPVVTTSVGYPARFGSVGIAAPGVEVRIVDDGVDAEVGDAGEIWVRGANVFQGYLDDPQATARVLDGDGWLHTGDIGLVDDDGWLYLIDRSKDLIIVSGFNVYPNEVEEVLAMHPGVAEVGVVGVPHPHTGEAVKAFVVTAPGAHLDEDELIDYAGEQLARYKCPSKIHFVDELPRNLNGKLLRRELH
jgi:long-chain acyl-CoA synthetase